MKVSVVIPTFNRRERLRRVLQGVAAQDVAPDEVIVVSDGSTDGTDEYLASGATPLPVIVGTQPNQGPAAARNLGVEMASGELVVFVDDDVVPEPQFVAAHLSAHERLGDKVVVIGPMLDPPDHKMSPWARWEQAMLYKQYKALEAGVYEATARQFYTGNASLPRRSIVEAGGFDVNLRRAEDVELAFRLRDAGLSFAFEPRAAGLHYVERSFDTWLDIADAYGRNDVSFGRVDERDLGSWITHNYRTRHPLVRLMTRLCVGRPGPSGVVTGSLRRITVGADRLGLDAVARLALSGIYNLAYYQGVADEIGGRDRLLALLGGGETLEEDPT